MFEIMIILFGVVVFISGTDPDKLQKFVDRQEKEDSEFK